MRSSRIRQHGGALDPEAAGFVDVVLTPFLLRDGFGSGLMIAHKREEPGGTRA